MIKHTKIIMSLLIGLLIFGAGLSYAADKDISKTKIKISDPKSWKLPKQNSLTAKVSPEVELKTTMGISKIVGKSVSVVGKISDTPWQHLIGYFPGYSRDYYFDVGKDQIVIYSKTAIDCTGKVKVYGKVVEVKGKSKDPRKDEVYREYHITVDKAECIK
jgi:hypothetical protein